MIPNLSLEQVFLTVVERRGSIASIDDVRREHLFACCNSDDPLEPSGGSASGDVADDERFVADCVQDHKGVGNAGDIYDEHDYLKEKKEAIEVLEAAVLKIVR